MFTTSGTYPWSFVTKIFYNKVFIKQFRTKYFKRSFRISEAMTYIKIYVSALQNVPDRIFPVWYNYFF